MCPIIIKSGQMLILQNINIFDIISYDDCYLPFYAIHFH